MKIDDVIFREVEDGAQVDPSSFCYFGWEGTGAYAFARYADAYYESACSLYEKILQSKGQYSVIDSLGITMCFCYRHYVELYLKYIYVKFVCKTEEDYKSFLNKGHNLVELWKASVDTLAAQKERVGSSVNINIVEQYIRKINKFDNESMSMRYPINKKLEPMHPSTRLDLQNLHNRMEELYYALNGLVCDLDNQITAEIDEKEIVAFKLKYVELSPQLSAFLSQVETYVDRTPREYSLSDFRKIPHPAPDEIPMTVYEAYNDDAIMLFDIMFYAGRDIMQHSVTLPIDEVSKQIDVIKLCIIHMKRDRFIFGKPQNNEVNIYGKCASAVFDNISAVTGILGIDKSEEEEEGL